MKAFPIRMRLALWYFLMFATAACVLSLSSWWMLRRSVHVAEYHELQERAEDVQSLLAHEAPGLTIDSMRRELTSIYSLKDDGKWLQVLDQDGNWIYRSKRLEQQNLELPLPDKLSKQGILSEFVQGTRYVRILDYPIKARGRAYSVQSGLAINRSMALLNSFGADLLTLTPAVLLLAALAGYWMSRKALGPIALLAAEARRINERNLDTRLPVPAAEDEIADLSRTLNQMLERIDRAFASVRAFTGNASHELRTPISLLRAEIEVALYRQREGEEYRAILARLHEETTGMTSLVENLLSLARAEGGAEIVALEPIQLKSLFLRVGQTWKIPMQAANVDFHIESECDHMACFGDLTSVLRLISILLENALKYTPPEGSVTLRATSSGHSVVLSVSDSGVGIASQDLPRIFDRFFRGEQANLQGPRGSGLGLALGKWIAERHGAQLQVKSAPGKGSCFSFALTQADAVITSEALVEA